MTTAQVTETASPRASRWGAVAGIAFVVFFVLRFVLLNTPDSDAPVEEWTETFQDSGDRMLSILGGYAMLLAGLAFLYFIWSLRSRFRLEEGASEGLSGLAFASGVVFVAMMFASGAAMSTVAASVEFGDNPVPDGEFARQLENLGFGLLLLYGMWAAGVSIVAFSGSALRTGAFPRWLAIAGIVVGVLVALGGVIFIPMVLLLLWVLTVSVVSLRT